MMLALDKNCIVVTMTGSGYCTCFNLVAGRNVLEYKPLTKNNGFGAQFNKGGVGIIVQDNNELIGDSITAEAGPLKGMQMGNP